MQHSKTKLRLYAFCNFYLNSISQGIQTAHVIGRMAKFYRHRDSAEAKLFWSWLEEGHENETIIVCNGGMAGDVFDAYQKFEPVLHESNIPSGIFYEEPRALGVAGSTPAPTCWACVLSAELYDARFQRGGTIIGEEFDTYVYRDVINIERYAASNKPGHPLAGMFGFLQYKNSCGLAK